MSKKILHKVYKKITRLGTRLSEFPKVLWLNLKLTFRPRDRSSFLVEITTTNEFFYLRSVLAALAKEGESLVLMTKHSEVKEALKLLINEHFTTTQAVTLIDSFWYNSIFSLDFYLNATLSYDIKVPKRAKYKINFPHTITSKTRYDVFSPAIEQMTDIFLTGPAFKEDTLRYCRDHNLARIPRLHEVGCPKSDVLFGPLADRKTVLEQVGLDTKLQTIFYAPTWNPETSLFTFWREVILSLPEKYNVNLVVKIHPGAYIDPSNKKSSGGVDWKQFFDSLESPKIYNAYRVDSPELIKASDLAITDISTIWIEYYFLRKSILFLDIPEFFKTHEMNSLGEFRNTYGQLVKTAAEFYEALERRLGDSKQELAETKLDDRLLYNRGRATEETLKAIKTLKNQ